jgi:hypothetical protein
MATARPAWTPPWTAWAWIGLVLVLVIGVLALWYSAGPYIR